MLERLPVRRNVRRLALLALAALALGTMPGLPARAQQTTTQPLDDTQVEFAQGTPLRTAVNAGVVPGSPRPFEDRDGILELAAAGNLRTWDVAQPSLPADLAYMGTVTIGNRLYTVGGATTGTPDNLSDAVYWANLDPQTGSIDDHGLTTPPAGAILVTAEWVNDPLPPAPAYMQEAPSGDGACLDEQIRGRRGPAVASFVTGGGASYIYTIGGAFLQTECGGDVVSSSAVQVGAVDAATGDITWSTAANQANYLPSQGLPDFESWDLPPTIIEVNGNALGVEGATASVVTAGNGETFLYVIGGLSTWVSPLGDLLDQITPAVFYTRLNPSTGALENPVGAAGSPWARGANVPLDRVFGAASPPGVLGIYNHTAIVSRALVGEGTGTTVRSAIYVTGGYTAAPSNPNSGPAQATVFRAIVNNDGSLTWETVLNPAAGGTVSIEGARAGLGGFAFGNKLYVLGGTPGVTANPLNTATVGVHDDQLNMLPLFGAEGGAPVYFTGAQSQVIEAVDGLGAAVIAATPPPGATEVTNAAWGYALGGTNASNQPTRIIRRGAIGGSAEAQQTVRIPDGWYYSRFFNLRFQSASEDLEARILSVRWFAALNRGANQNADLRVEFQRTKLLPCNEAAFANSPWVPLDSTGPDDAFFSQNGFNEVELRDIFPTEDFTASCFRYRVFMTQNGSTNGVPNPAGDPNVSPQLYSINVEKVRPGDPDLQVAAFDIATDTRGRVSTFDLRITNLNGTVLNTIAIIQERFPAVLCVAYSPDGPPDFTVPPLPVENDADGRVNCAPVYRWVDSSETIPGQDFSLTSGNKWQVNFDNVVHIPGKVQEQELGDPREAFAVPGHYAVAVLLDPFNVVPEGGQGKANNRGENLTSDGQPKVVRFQVTGYSVSLPLVVR